ncbi:uncharacterized protein LY89DRAFT_692509 [Mollisia scopiformis]|uniref:Uncharacterized protein n=1 Tax=Mollisia scopiformis TaxID=149040 RepID=A0A132B390_MOLSC|nr:uncharacterized protein LY89DRAFT_692509 [Mollisia scopiformis]KUJ06384.1 hypothetical protein LY89DRAFT_692509 [Mollisia scopiformis]
MAPLTFTEAEIELMVAIINQVGAGGINGKKLQQDLGLSSLSTTTVRLSRFRAKLAKASAGEGTPSPNKDKLASPKKKRKLEKDDIEDREIDDEEHVETPSRKLPGRRARVTLFKDESKDDFEIPGQSEGEE